MEFVERYRVLIPGLKLCDVTDFKYTSKMLCNRVLKDEHDWQIGVSKVFLKVRWYAAISLVLCTEGPPILFSLHQLVKDNLVHLLWYPTSRLQVTQLQRSFVWKRKVVLVP